MTDAVYNNDDDDNDDDDESLLIAQFWVNVIVLYQLQNALLT